MKLFLLIFFALYGSMHAYAFLKVRAAVAPGTPASIFLAALMCLMVVAPLLVRLAEGGGRNRAAWLLAWGGYSWMGLLFLFFSLSLAFDLLRLSAAALKATAGLDMSLLSAPPRTAFLLILGLSALLSLYGAYEALDVRTEEITIGTGKMPRLATPLTVVQISDVHLGLIVRKRRLEAILDKVRRAQPDLLLSTGDLVDGQQDQLDGLSALFGEIRPRYGKYAVTGNHEHYAGLDHSLAFTSKAGFRLLRGEGVEIGGLLTLAGVDDPAVVGSGGGAGVREADLLSSFPRDRFTILLKHRPVIDEAASRIFDLQVSGHTHKGQIFPFGLLTRLTFPVHTGTVKTPAGSTVHVSRGSGTWGPPIRLLSPPEVTVLRIEGRG